MTTLIYLTTACFLLLMNAFFVAAEFGMVRLRQTRIAAIQKTGLRGRILAEIHLHLDAYLSACQLGVTLASIGLGWVAEPAFSNLLHPLFLFLNLQSQELITIISFIVTFTLISFLHIVIGELIPKSLALRQSEKVSLWTATPLYAFYWVMYPAIWLLNSCAMYLLKKSGLDTSHRGEHFYSTDEIKLILNTSHLHGEITKDEAEILEHTMDFAELKVTEVMRPQEEMISLDVNTPIEETLKIAVSHRFSRYPIYENDPNNIIGIIHVKDLFATLYQAHTLSSLREVIRPILKVSQRLPAISLLRKFREGMPHFALVYKNHDNLLGFVTLDNLLHILIGRIKDEFHLTQDDWITNPDGSLLVRGDCPIFSLERALDKDLYFPQQEPEPETLAAAIINQLGRLPRLNEVIEFQAFTATILKIRGSKMISIKILPRRP